MTPAFVIALAALLHPGTRATADEVRVARAIAEVATVDAPMPGRSREETAAILVVTAFEESRFRNVRGDHGAAHCAFQIHARSIAEARALDRSVVACTRRALVIARASATYCPSAPLAPYAGGCSRPAARRISARRLELAAALLRPKRGAMGPMS